MKIVPFQTALIRQWSLIRELTFVQIDRRCHPPQWDGTAFRWIAEMALRRPEAR